ncbi:MAG: dTDP-4-dehydrorhamnose 3,5-epimerase [Bacteroidales bacterium]|nr:dTDP-4-dehydrorhamnose 3,5-epimerase [Bacteroidales bacterium]
MHLTETPFKGLYVIEPLVHSDDRGCFFESWNKKTFAAQGIHYDFVQDNQSHSGVNVIRGLHVQLPPFEQGKLLRVSRGAVLDVAVDLRRTEPTFGRHFKILLNDRDHKMLLLPPGFAHGFRTLEENTLFVYKCTNFYNRESERAIRWDDPDLAIDWETDDPQLSGKDKNAMLFRDFVSPF